MNFQKILKWTFVVISGAIFFFLWYGFLFPDPFFLSQMAKTEKFVFLWGPRFILPIMFLGLIYLSTLKSKKKIRRVSILYITPIIILIVLYPVIDYYYNTKVSEEYEKIKKNYSSYLQHKPLKFEDNINTPSENHFTIFCLGGSTTEIKNKDSIGWPQMLEDELRNHYKTESVRVFNFGKECFTSLHNLINYQVNLRKYKPDVILLMNGINDLTVNADFSYFSTGSFESDYGHYAGPVSYLLESKGLMGNIITRFKQMMYHESRQVITRYGFSGLKSYFDNINTLIDLAQVDSTKIILMSQPYLLKPIMSDIEKEACHTVNTKVVGEKFKWSHNSVFIGMKMYNNKIARIAELRNVNFIDLHSKIPKSLEYFIDDVHYHDNTFPLISKTIAEEIIKLNIIGI